MLVNRIHYYMDYYGTFDEDKRSRDYVSDLLVTRLVLNVPIYIFLSYGKLIVYIIVQNIQHQFNRF